MCCSDGAGAEQSVDRRSVRSQVRAGYVGPKARLGWTGFLVGTDGQRGGGGWWLGWTNAYRSGVFGVHCDGVKQLQFFSSLFPLFSSLTSQP